MRPIVFSSIYAGKFKRFALKIQMVSSVWALSSAGRAPDLHSGGQEFDSPSVHQIPIDSKPRIYFRGFDFMSATSCNGLQCADQNAMPTNIVANPT